MRRAKNHESRKLLRTDSDKLAISQLRKSLLRGLHLIIYDFDGVMTDNRALLMEDGREAVFVHRGDGLAVALIKEMGIPQIILSTEANPIVTARALKLGIPVLQSVTNKKNALKEILKARHVASKDVIFVGNDLNDKEAMLSVGWPIAPADASPPIKKIARIVLSSKGGHGVLRELLDLLKNER